ncbi:unnamed protein product [Gongylonema pulchrum]|uniref:Uncharacterized protein n=1 Tax=Gongylonema pulchrum TaxID=637853 RepID=A0A3P7NV73_9BILA|nr:unnamed protein product [Gongylonema pulchrum]
MDIFEERQIYSKSQLADMRAAQSDSNEMEDNSLLDFDTGCLIRDIEGYHKGNLVMERARELLSRSDFNFRDKIKSRMKEIERAKRSFALQLRDATVVEDAYQKFGAGIDEVRAEVEEMLKSGFYPGASPPRDAPSPTANDDPFKMKRSQSISGALPLPDLKSLKEEAAAAAVTASKLLVIYTFFWHCNKNPSKLVLLML